jgi:crotonobetainyl-CoA:carnitine CoA-transferase CaiB-like acyl-CoA transferase
VIKVERPGDGDDQRRNYLQLEPGRRDQSTYFIRVNAGKESVAVDLSRPEGQAVVRDLARRADVMVENFMPGVVARLACDYDSMRVVKPDLIYCSISGFGQTGPWRARPAFAHIVNAISGLMRRGGATRLEFAGRRRARRHSRRGGDHERAHPAGADRAGGASRRLHAGGAGGRRQHDVPGGAQRG